MIFKCCPFCSAFVPDRYEEIMNTSFFQWFCDFGISTSTLNKSALRENFWLNWSNFENWPRMWQEQPCFWLNVCKSFKIWGWLPCVFPVFQVLVATWWPSRLAGSPPTSTYTAFQENFQMNPKVATTHLGLFLVQVRACGFLQILDEELLLSEMTGRQPLWHPRCVNVDLSEQEAICICICFFSFISLCLGCLVC